MNKYEVCVTDMASGFVYVDAKDKDEAERLVWEKLENGLVDLSNQGEITIDFVEEVKE